MHTSVRPHFSSCTDGAADGATSMDLCLHLRIARTVAIFADPELLECGYFFAPSVGRASVAWGLVFIGHRLLEGALRVRSHVVAAALTRNAILFGIFVNGAIVPAVASSTASDFVTTRDDCLHREHILAQAPPRSTLHDVESIGEG